MRTLVVGVVVLVFSAHTSAAEPPLVEKYLHTGELAKGEQALEAAMAAAPDDDNLRFSLGILKFIRGIERLGQSLYEYGVKSESTSMPFLRLPVPKNPQPSAVSYSVLRRVLDDFLRDLDAAEKTFAKVTDEQVKLRLRLARIRLDLTGEGKPNDKLLDILQKLMRQRNFAFLETNPAFLVCFDRGDVAWFRAYCHLLMGMIDFYLAFDGEESFNLTAHELFEKPKKKFAGTDEERNRKLVEVGTEIAVKEPKRLSRCRKHFIRVAELNRETWKYIRAETDDDHEWLPNAKQTGVFGMPVRDDMIDGWLGMMSELEAVLEGKKTFLKSFGLDKDGKGLNLKTLFEDPPEKFSLNVSFPKNLPDKYFSNGPEMDIGVIFRMFTLFGNTTDFAYAMWFN